MAALTCALAVYAGGARAQTSASAGAAAEQLFAEARELMARGHVSEACAKFAESERLDPGGGTILNLAVCHETEGRLATAWAEYKEALALARRDERPDREALAKQHIRALEPKLPRLTIRLAADAAVPQLEVLRDGVVAGPASLGVAVPIDAGEHAIEARAPGYVSWSTRVDMRTRESQAVEIPKLAEAPRPAAPSKPEGVARPAASPHGSVQRRIGFVAGGLGIVALGVGTGFGIAAFARERDARDLCGGTDGTCASSDGVEASDEAGRDATVANVAFGVGLVALGAGVVLILTSRSGASTAAATAYPLGIRF